MSSSKLYAIFIWYKDTPVTGNVLSLSAVVEPRKDFKDYKIGDLVKARCGSFGVVPAVIGMIADENGKKEIERVLKVPRSFQELVESRPEVEEMREKLNQEGETLANRSVDNSEKEERKDTAFTTKDFSAGKALKTKIVKPRPVKRKLPVEIDSRFEEKLQSSVEDRILDNLRTVEEELNKTDFHGKEVLVIENSEERIDCSQLVGESLSLVSRTGMTPKKPKSPMLPEQNDQDTERLKSENSEFFGRVSNLEYSVSQMWHEMEKLKAELLTCQQAAQTIQPYSPQTPQQYIHQVHQSAFCSPSSFSSSSPTLHRPTATATVTSPSQLEQPEQPEGENLDQMTERTYNGYIKSQVVAEIKRHSDYKKATAKIFRMLFTLEERTGRSISGQKSNTGVQRPAIEDKDKLKFIEDVIKEQWEHTQPESIRMVIRDILKPSRTRK